MSEDSKNREHKHRKALENGSARCNNSHEDSFGYRYLSWCRKHKRTGLKQTTERLAFLTGQIYLFAPSSRTMSTRYCDSTSG